MNVVVWDGKRTKKEKHCLQKRSGEYVVPTPERGSDWCVAYAVVLTVRGSDSEAILCVVGSGIRGEARRDLRGTCRNRGERRERLRRGIRVGLGHHVAMHN